MVNAPLIAIVDDAIDIVEMLEMLLEMEGYRTVSTQTGAAVPALLAAHRPALLILDLRLEQPPSGWAVLDALRADPATARLPVVICSAERNLAQRVVERADPYLTSLAKPFQSETLLAAIHGLLGTGNAQATAL